MEKLDNARTAKEIKIVAAGERQKERPREMEEERHKRVFNPPTMRESLPNLFIGLPLRGTPVCVQLATTAEDAKTDLPESSLTKFA